jgi:hypothetical protein
MKPLVCFAAVLCCVPAYGAGRVVLSLDGIWDIADSVSATDAPSRFDHKVPVPGLVHSSTPAFPDVDQFDSREVIVNRVSKKLMPRSALVTNAGVPHQDRKYFWYRTTFEAKGQRSVALLRINKAQFGAAVWVNGTAVGEHLPCFTSATFNITGAVRWSSTNEVLVRIGAHPGVLPENVSAGTDFEKNRWTPGIYDSVSVIFADNPVIDPVQVAPHIATSEAIVQTVVRNYGAAPVSFTVQQSAREWKGVAVVGSTAPQRVSLGAGESKTIVQTMKIPNAKLWSPEQPNLYLVETTTPGDSVTTRFGMREFRFDTPTRRAYLNGHVYFLRGSNITLHRFFEDPKSGQLPWDDAWLRKLLVEIPKQMHWNAFRFCIGPVPDRWLEIADEAGLLIQNEYFVWTGHNWHGKDYVKTFDPAEMITEYTEWMRDNWNHPSVAIWDANNETWNPVFGEKIIPAVRSLDLSNRPWENSYNPPVGPDDPVEDHPYEFIGENFRMTDLERGPARGSQGTGHAMILNEYGWLWLNRDGSPTELTKSIYPRLLPEGATAEDRFAMNAYLLGGITEFWRAHRQYAGILHFVYLTSSDPDGFTSDHFRDVEKLKLDPYFADYMGEAFKPLGVYINFWQPTLAAGSERELYVMLVNDEPSAVKGTLAVTLESQKGEQVWRHTQPFDLAALGQQTLYVPLKVPLVSGHYMLKATAISAGARSGTISRRKVEIVRRTATHMAKPAS